MCQPLIILISHFKYNNLVKIEYPNLDLVPLSWFVFADEEFILQNVTM